MPHRANTLDTKGDKHMGEHEYVEDNPLYAEPASGEFDEDRNLIGNVRRLLEEQASYTAIARYVWQYDSDMLLGETPATLALVMVLRGHDDETIATVMAAGR